MLRRILITDFAGKPHRGLKASLFSTAPPQITPPFIHQCQTVLQAKLVHQQLLVSGTLTLNLASHLIGTYISLGCSSSSCSFLRRYPPSDSSVYHWNSLIRLTLHHGRLRESLSLFRLMHSLSWTPDNYTFPFVLKACGELRSRGGGASVHALAWVTGFETNSFVGNALVTMYERCGFLGDAWKVFDEMLVRGVWDIVSWNSMMTGFVQRGEPKKALGVFTRMTNEFGIIPDVISLVQVLPSCASLGSCKEGKQAHGFAIRNGLMDNMFVSNGVMDMYAKCGMMDEANKVFSNMTEKDVVSWNSMVAGYSQIGRFDDAIRLFDKMREEKIEMDVVTWTSVISGFAQRDLGHEALGVFREMLSRGSEPNNVTLVSVLSGCASVGALNHGKEIHCYAVKHDSYSDKNASDDDDNIVVNGLIDMYGKCKRDDVARAMFDSIAPKDRNVVTWTAMIGGYAQHGEASKALELFSEMFKQDCHRKPNSFTLACALMACARLATLRTGKQIHAYVLRHHHDAVTLFVLNCLIDMYAKCGDVEDAQMVFDGLREMNEVSWTSLMTGYGMHGRGEAALKIFDEMRQLGFTPDGITLLVVLYACSHSGMVDQGMEYFNRMEKDFGVVPGSEHYACAVDMLGRAGRLDEAFHLIEEMPMDPTFVVWVALLNGCTIHGKVQLGEHAERKLSELASNNDGSYTLLSNLYANARRWKDVARIRSLMKHTGIKKRPGCSWVEGIKGTATFFVGDRTHPRTKEIYQILAEFMQRIKDLGYVPETKFALHDVDDEEKGDLLLEHSEKLALAYGILTTPGGAPIRITKNLRVCGDCHTAFTYISKLIDHEIVLRDSSRFHHFKNGSCSCKGYW
ncbi:PREDICTED: pentatricopeptide repeat-containing protein At5g16860 [Tarenaya hassleriana]|uniref:pentatricopeptide repeat-containing protein At5g16860 n=1 Tax=Tarenaya hassleriana TaxID=28532 RepID=UPI00053C0EBE|nr:PREDICTED: pentatricopeptide repeat-containing protein At5g16860 [Tarenaya hassleriana]